MPRQKLGPVLGIAVATAFLLLPAVTSSLAQSDLKSLDVSSLQQKADAGDGAAQTELGQRYESGRGGFAQDYAQARLWYEKAADQAFALAQYFLGFMYEKGQGVPKDLALAREWYQKAADTGEPQSLARLKELNSSAATCDPNWSPKLDQLASDANSSKAAIQHQMDRQIAKYGGVDGSIDEFKREIQDDQEQLARYQEANDEDGADKLRAAISMDWAFIDILSCRQSMSAQSTSEAGGGNSPESQATPNVADVRFTKSDSRPLSGAEMAALRDSLRWEPESARVPYGGLAVSYLVDGDGRRLGSIQVQWTKTVVPKGAASQPGGAAVGSFTFQMENGTSCGFLGEAELYDAKGLLIVSSLVLDSWVGLRQPDAGQTIRVEGDAALPNQNPVITFRPIVVGSALSACLTPENP